MDTVTLENYRCFRDRQTAHLAPLTLLVGENGAGKTAFLTHIRALWDMDAPDDAQNLRSDCAARAAATAAHTATANPPNSPLAPQISQISS